jgi:hypothetical protein
MRFIDAVSVSQLNDTIRSFESFLVVRGNDYGLVVFSSSRERIHHFCSCFSIQLPSWFVGQDEWRLTNKRSRNSDTLLFTPTQFAWSMCLPISEANAFEQLGGTPPS